MIDLTNYILPDSSAKPIAEEMPEFQPPGSFQGAQCFRAACNVKGAAPPLAHLILRDGLELIIQNVRPEVDMTFQFLREASPIHFGYLLAGTIHTVIEDDATCFFNGRNSAGCGGIMFLPHTISQGHYEANRQVLGVSVDVSPELFGELAGEAAPALPAELRDLAQGKNSSSGFILPSKITARLSGVLHEILSIRPGAPCAGLFAEAKALELLSLQIEQLIQAHPSAGFTVEMDRADRAGVGRVCEILSESLQNPPSLLDMSREAGMSHSKLNRCFKQLYGLTVFEWLRQARLDKARELLINGACSIAEAALCSGFSDQSHLNRCFKSHFGVTPGQFRRARRS
jgi:AraC family transcriptional activator of pyochelin receptor